MRVVYHKPFDFHPKGEPRVIIERLPSDDPVTVTREEGERAIRGGYAKAHKEAKPDESGKSKA